MNEVILITGGEGVLGSYFSFGTRMGQKDFDVTDFDTVMRVCTDMRPRAIVHCAALTDLSFCEKNPERAYLVNSVGTYHMALAARVVGAKLIYISTSDVFDGSSDGLYTEKDTPNPVTVYGRSKHLGELAVAGVLEDHLIVRVSWMFGGGPGKDDKFVGKILAQKGVPEIRAVMDKKGSPSWARDIAVAVRKLLNEDARGIYHVGGGVATRYEMAQEIASIAGWETKVVPVDSSEFVSAYPIGENQSMPLSTLVRPWRESLQEYIETEWDIMEKTA